MFVLQVAADIFANKTNFELTFNSRPSLLELTRAIEAAFSNEIAIRRADSIPQHSFHVAKLKGYDEERNKWVDLLSEAQLVDYGQLYAFQPENPWHKESQKEIPAAVKPPSSAQRYNSNTSRTGSTAGGGYQQPTTAAAAQSTSYVPASNAAAYQPAAYRSTAGGSAPSSSSLPQQQMQQQPAIPRVNLNATEDEKLRIVFAEFDIKGNRMIDMEDMKQGFRTLGLEFTTATMNDLFSKGDINSDGRISYSEFDRFAKLYPIMMDCLFYRSKAFWDEENHNRELLTEKEAVRQAQDRAVQAQQQVQAAAKGIDDATDATMAAEGDLKDLAARLRDAAKEVDGANRDKERLMKEKFDRENDVAATKDRDRQARQQFQDAAREAEKQDRRAQQATQEALKADEKVRALQQQLQDAQRQGDRAAQVAKQAVADADAARAREKDTARAAENVARELPKAEEAAKSVDANLGHANDRLRDLDGLAKDLSRDADEAARRRDAGERAAIAARDNEAKAQQEAERARRYAEDREKQARAKEEELLEAQRQRQLITQHERALIEQELRLREQRDSLEEKESKLKNEATSFLGNLRHSMSVPGAGRSYSRDPSIASALY